MARPTKYEFCERELLKRIENRFYETSLPSERGIGEEFNLSRSTVRKVLSRLRDKGVIESSGGKGYYVVNGAGPVGSTPRQIDLMMRYNLGDWDISHPSNMLQGILEEKLALDGCRLNQLSSSLATNPRELKEQFSSCSGEALVVDYGIYQLFDSAWVNEFLSSFSLRHRVVILSQEGPAVHMAVDCVFADWRPGVQEAVDMLIEEGCRRIIFAGFDGVHWSDVRKRAFLARMAARNRWNWTDPEPCSPFQGPVEFDQLGRPVRVEEQALDDLLKHCRANPDIDAVVCANDKMAQLLSANLGSKSKPRLVGFDNSVWARENNIPSVAMNMSRMIDELLALLRRPPYRDIRHLGIPTMLVRR